MNDDFEFFRGLGWGALLSLILWGFIVGAVLYFIPDAAPQADTPRVSGSAVAGQAPAVAALSHPLVYTATVTQGGKTRYYSPKQIERNF